MLSIRRQGLKLRIGRTESDRLTVNQRSFLKQELSTMLTLGLSSFTHDAAAALLEDGVIKAAIEDSKLVRSNTHGLPETAMRYCLAKRGISWHELDVVAVASRPFKGWLRRSLLPLRHSSSLPLASAY